MVEKSKKQVIEQNEYKIPEKPKKKKTLSKGRTADPKKVIKVELPISFTQSPAKNVVTEEVLISKKKLSEESKKKASEIVKEKPVQKVS